MSSEPGIGWVPATSATIVRLRNIVPKGTVVVPCADGAELLEAVTVGRIGLTVIEAGTGSNAVALLALRRVREAFPEHPVIAWCDVRTIETSTLLEIARAGVQELIRHDFDELRHVFTRIASAARRRAVSGRISAMIGGRVPATLRPVLLYALEHADEVLDRDAIAAAFGVSRRTLHNRLVAARLPTTRPFLNWCRLLVASALLEQPGHTLDSVAGQLDFSSGENLGKALRRYTGMGIMQLREHGVLREAVTVFRNSTDPRAAPVE